MQSFTDSAANVPFTVVSLRSWLRYELAAEPAAALAAESAAQMITEDAAEGDPGVYHAVALDFLRALRVRTHCA